jgi:hypothetical protein
MTNPEFSAEFDILYNSVTSNAAPGLNEYEKSVFLTMAQEQIVKGYFNNKTNKLQEGFDKSPDRQIDFSSLMTTKTLEPQGVVTQFDPRGVTYVLPKDILVMINEAVTSNKKRYVVMPISFEQYDKLMLKPYPYPVKNGVWRLITNANTPDTEGEPTPATVEIIGKISKVASYTLRYIRKPRPIILEDLSNDDLTINGESEVTSCELNSRLHPDILQRAVELASAAYKGDLQTQIGLGAVSQTELGYATGGDRRE